MTSQNKISGLIITYNEEKNIAELLSNIAFVDEIVIVDSYSTDHTKALALLDPKVRFIEHPFTDFTSQRNFALDNATYNWILFLDGDERITDSLKQEITETVSVKNSKDAYYFYRKFLFQGELIHFSGTQTDKNFRLFKKASCKYTPNRLVHETLEVQGNVGVLKNKLLHYSYYNYDDYKNKMIKYGILKSQELFLRNKNSTLFHRYVKPLYKFLYNFFIRLGLLDGYKGMIICYLHALSVYVTYDDLSKKSR